MVIAEVSKYQYYFRSELGRQSVGTTGDRIMTVEF